MRRRRLVLISMGAMTGVLVQAQQVPRAGPAPSANVPVTGQESIPHLDRLGAHQAVREGNRRLLQGDPSSALAAYAWARNLRPDAPEIPFVEGLAHFAQKQYVQARKAFKMTAASDNASLAVDALYGIGTTYHAEAFQKLQDPKSSIQKLERAMQRYREVLAIQPDHEAARTANYKAAFLRRRLKGMLEQQQQQEQQQDQQRDQENKAQRDEQYQQTHDAEEQQKEQAPQPQVLEGPERQTDRREAALQKQNEQLSREQAERRLREMVQAIHEREKMHRTEVRRIPVAPVDKDW